MTGSNQHSEVRMDIPGDSIFTSPEWVSATRRAFPLLHDAEIVEAFQRLRIANDFEQERLDAEVDRG